MESRAIIEKAEYIDLLDKPVFMFGESQQEGPSHPSFIRTSRRTWRIHRIIGGVSAAAVTGGMLIALAFEMLRLAVEITDNAPGLAHVIFLYAPIGSFALLIPPALCLVGTWTLVHVSADASRWWQPYACMFGAVLVSGSAYLIALGLALGLEWLVRSVYS